MWHYKTRIGVFYISLDDSAQYCILFKDEILGRYPLPQQAVDDLTAGHSFWPACGTDPETLNIPDEIGDWVAGNP